MIQIDFDKIISVDDLLSTNNMSNLIRNNNESRGLYFFYDMDEVLLYIGWSVYLHERIREHIKGSTSTSVQFYEDIKTIKILYESSFETLQKKYRFNTDIEYYLIKRLNPKHNIAGKLGRYTNTPPWVFKRFRG